MGGLGAQAVNKGQHVWPSPGCGQGYLDKSLSLSGLSIPICQMGVLEDVIARVPQPAFSPAPSVCHCPIPPSAPQPNLLSYLERCLP